MKTRSVIGQKIVGVGQERRWTNSGLCYDVFAIRLENGVVITPMVMEMDGEYAVDMTAHPPGKVHQDIEAATHKA